MKWLKSHLLLLLILGVLISSTSCTFEDSENAAPDTTMSGTTAQDALEEAYKKDPAHFVEFTRSTEPRQQYVPFSELLEYKTQYPDCNGTWFRDQLYGEDLIIYNSYLYALENRYIGFNLYVEDSDKDFTYIRELVSLDSPFLEQNYSHYEHIWKRPVNYIGKQIYVSMEQFTDSRWEMKMEALAKCKQIVQNIPAEHQTPQAKMEYLYDYVCDNVKYVTYESMADESYFYDAVCKGETLCDGYSNMLSLLFRMIGVECCEVIGENEEGQDGHTWVVAKLNDVFYNFDPTFEDTSEIPSEQRKYFGFSDDLVSTQITKYEELRPKCMDSSRDFLYADITVTSLTAREDVRKIVLLSEEKLAAGENTTLVGVETPVDSEQYDVFFEYFSLYATRCKKISLYTWPMQNAALIEVNLE